MKRLSIVFFLSSAITIWLAGAAITAESTAPNALTANTSDFLGLIKWEWNPPELNRNGAWNVQFFGTMLSIKPGFVRGDFDVSSGGYKILPVASITDVTDVTFNEIAMYPYIFAGSRAKCHVAPTGTFYFEFTDKALTMATCENGKPDYSFVETITYSQWMNAWARNASKYCNTGIGDYCLISQELMSPGGTVNHGFVASKGSLLSDAGLPGDYIEVEISTAVPQHLVDTPLACAPPLNLVFERARPRYADLWKIYKVSDKEAKTFAEKRGGGEYQIAVSTDNPVLPISPMGRWLLSKW